MDKECSLVVGTIGATAVAIGIGTIVTSDFTWGFLIGVAYLALCGFTWIVFALRRMPPRFSDLSARETLWMPFLAIFLIPLWLAVLALVHEWDIEDPMLRYAAIVAGFLLSIPSLLLHRWLSGVSIRKEKRPNQ